MFLFRSDFQVHFENYLSRTALNDFSMKHLMNYVNLIMGKPKKGRRVEVVSQSVDLDTFNAIEQSKLQQKQT